MSRTWPLQEAKNKLSEVVECALREGPQVISRRGKDAVVVVSVEEYRRLRQPRETLIEFFRRSPLRGVDLRLERDKDEGRALEL